MKRVVLPDDSTRIIEVEVIDTRKREAEQAPPAADATQTLLTPSSPASAIPTTPSPNQPPKRRRSLRDTNVRSRAKEHAHRDENLRPTTLFSPQRLFLSFPQRLVFAKTSLFYRRLQELFFDESSDRESVRYGHHTLRRVHFKPNIYVIDGFLSTSDIEYLGTQQASQFQKSFVDNHSEALYDNQHRTSTFLSFGKQQNSRIALLEGRASDLLGCSSTRVEPLQLVRYQENQFFGVHHDMAEYDEDADVVTLPAKSMLVKRRIVTIFCNVNGVESGGETSFPKCTIHDTDSLKITPKPGQAIVFSNVTGQGQPDIRTLHAGLPVLSGTKYGLNIWICEE